MGGLLSFECQFIKIKNPYSTETIDILIRNHVTILCTHNFWQSMKMFYLLYLPDTTQIELPSWCSQKYTSK